MKKLLCLLISLTLCTPLYATEKIKISDFKGLQRNPSSDKIEDGSHDKFQDVYIKDNNIDVIKGWERINSTANTDPNINGYGVFEVDSTTTYLVVAEDTDIVRYDKDGTNRVSILAGLTADEWSFAEIGQYFYMSSETNGLWGWDGTLAPTQITQPADPPTPGFFADETTRTVEGQLTPGDDAIVIPKYTYDSPGSPYALINGVCVDRFFRTRHFTSDISKVSYYTIPPWTTANYIKEEPTFTTYQYKYTFFNPDEGIESSPSSVASSTNLLGAYFISLVPIQVYDTYSDAGCTATTSVGSVHSEVSITAHEAFTSTLNSSAVVIPSPYTEVCYYRTVADGDDFFKVDCVDDVLNVEDKVADVNLGSTLDTTIITIAPPSSSLIEGYKGTLFTANGRELRFSHVPVGEDSSLAAYWQDADKFTFNSDIVALHAISDSLLVIDKNNIHEISGASGNFTQRTLIKGVGCVSDKTIVSDNNGDMLCFSGIRGVYRLNIGRQSVDNSTGARLDTRGTALTRISSPAIEDIFRGRDEEVVLDIADYSSAIAYYDNSRDLYFLYIGDVALLWDNLNFQWSYIPAAKFKAALYVEDALNDSSAVLFDDLGFRYTNFTGYSRGNHTGDTKGVVTSSTVNTLTDTLATFDTTDDGLEGAWVFVDNEQGEWNRVTSNTADTLTLENNWVVNPNPSDNYYIGHLIPNWRTKNYNIPGPPTIQRGIGLWTINEVSDYDFDIEVDVYLDKIQITKLQKIINVTNKFFTKLGMSLASPFIQWEYRAFLDEDDKGTPPIRITGYQFEFEIIKER